MLEKILILIATLTFAWTGVLAVTQKGQKTDILGVGIFAVFTAIGGGTVRDLLLDVPVFWIEDPTLLYWALMAGLLLFVFRNQVMAKQTWLNYLDAFGLALFAIQGAYKAYQLGFGVHVVIVTGLLTGMGGGALRDVLAGTPTLIMSRQLYISPALVGVCLYTGGLFWGWNHPLWTLLCALLIFLLRAVAIYFKWSMPQKLLFEPGFPKASKS